jgi:hypothetical protein
MTEFEEFRPEIRAKAQAFLGLREPSSGSVLSRTKEGKEGSEGTESSETTERSETTESSENTERTETREVGASIARSRPW